MASLKAASQLVPGDSLVMRIWPPVGLVMGVAATIAWSLFLVYQVLVLIGLVS